MAVIKINQKMRKECVIKATEVMFKERINKLTSDFYKKVYEAIIALPVNKESQELYDSASHKTKRVFMLTSSAYVRIDNKVQYVGNQLTSHSLGTQANPYQLFNDNTFSLYNNSISFPKSVCLIQNDLSFDKDKEPKWVTTFIAKHKALRREIEEFINDTSYALSSINNVRQLDEHLPKLKKYMDIVEYTGTALGPSALYDKVNNAVK